jgi:RHS repeat-associated protein
VLTTTKYYDFGDQRIAVRQNGTLSYLHGDHLGSTSVTTNNAGTKTNDVRYFAYGGPRSGNLFALPTDHTFTGQKLDKGSGLLYYGARYYDSALGTFISPDPLIPDPGNPQDLNRYSYTLNNPLRYMDPTGHAPSEQVPIPYNWLFELGRMTQQMANALTVQAAPVAVPLTQYGPQLSQFAQGLDAMNQVSNEAGNFGDPSRWNPNQGPERENRVREMLSRRYQQAFGVSDAEIRTNLGIQGKTADFVGYNSGNGRWLIAESKGSDIDMAIKQLQNTMNGLLNKTGFQPGDIDLRVYTNTSNYQRLFNSPGGLGGYLVRDGFLGYTTEAGEWVWQLINGIRVSVQAVP